MPTTSQPSVGDFLKVYEKLAGQVKSIISVHISGGISGTVQSARSAAQMLRDVDITVVDSQSTAMGLYSVVDAAARAARHGWGRNDVLRVLNHVKDKVSFLIMPDTLEYLSRGGRIGGAAAVLGNLLQIKPVLFFNKEKGAMIDVYQKIRTKRKGIQLLLDEMAKAYSLCPDLKTGVSYVDATADAEALAAEIKSQYPELSPEIIEAGPVVGSHIGPGSLGISFYPLTPELKTIVPY